MSIEQYIAEQFALTLDLDVRDFDVEIDDETYTVSLMTDDEPECQWTFECGSDDDYYVFTRVDADATYPMTIRIPLMPE